mmetsp:Transcript_22568/g.89290  ORF Transcript_22568/g.89290 Transcript_22568/m.89290 type:complete len:659 (+) Transcript_22568:182-2158(+)|eukprot:CAMPEP_0114609362 /NCGR_PEP_ID=MMETSP0168-20121206/3051_1 /TAXON_ID=95228 ORGANISM="Vannella sp., Strain DIVA3 517/6/12" /NCGR_SAMPLE_ID=MMETSP0168 /ASSEMBLY_ACC=CAM_ASM_000044 /LENGTH=658 /DNA_ID=CAMNT_0001820281 /DNA_START=127 /DNA_END=2103 /DNA_ORIENTATION=+
MGSSNSRQQPQRSTSNGTRAQRRSGGTTTGNGGASVKSGAEKVKTTATSSSDSDPVKKGPGMGSSRDEAVGTDGGGGSARKQTSEERKGEKETKKKDKEETKEKAKKKKEKAEGGKNRSSKDGKDTKKREKKEEEKKEKELFEPLKASEIREHIASGQVAKEWSELTRAEMLDNRQVAVHMHKDRYYGRFVYEHSRVRLGGGYLNADVVPTEDSEGASPAVSPADSATKESRLVNCEEGEEEDLCGVEADSGSNEIAAAVAKPHSSFTLSAVEEESSATVYSDCDSPFGGGVSLGQSGGGAGGQEEEEESSAIFPSYSGSSGEEEEEDDDDEDNDYINANFLVDHKYICTQAPVPETLVDFWRMIWEQKVDLIVMLTRLEEGERLKAHRYWPTMDKLYKSYKGQFQVTILSEKVLVEEQIVVRRLALKDVRVVIPLELSSEVEEEETEEGDGSEVALTNPALDDDDGSEEEVDPDARVITQLHYIGWPDHGVPNNFVYILEMLKLVDAHQKKQELARAAAAKTSPPAKKEEEEKKKNADSTALVEGEEKQGEVPPIVVHCSAGVGRSGTFVVAHMELTRLRLKYKLRFGEGDVEEEKWKQLLNEESFEIGPAVKMLRRDRRTMVQREEQLLFLYELFEHMAAAESKAVVPFSPSCSED